ncbi:MAG: hypothetical protein HY736_11225, partial [Verrucomicrobia bacterium]|nr:hypothetical protein [Verrucomicrobiota bacterium]
MRSGLAHTVDLPFGREPTNTNRWTATSGRRSTASTRETRPEVAFHLEPTGLLWLGLLFLTAVVAPATSASAAESGPTGPGRSAYVMQFDGDWRVAGGLPEKVLLLSLQGLANRTEPRLYVVHPRDFQWEITEPLFNFYERRHG